MKNSTRLTSNLRFFRLFSLKKLVSTLCLGSILILYADAAWSQANTELSNLASPTKVNVNLMPTNDNSKNLGSDSKSWKDIYLDGNLYLDGEMLISNPGIANLFVGNPSGNISSTGNYNSAFGSSTLIKLTTGFNNSAFGSSGLYNTTTGANNSAFGNSTLVLNSSGNHNSAFGSIALFANTTGSYNSAFGGNALRSCSTGTENSAFGYGAMYECYTGSYNSAFGNEALYSNSGEKNTAIGNQAGIGNTTGNYGTFLGFDAGGSNSTGSQNTYLGYSTEGSSNAFTNVVGIGYQLTNTASNQARIGNSSTTSIGGWASWSNVSDGRFKKNVKEEVGGLDFINKLRPVTYTLDLHGADAFIGKEFTGDNESEESLKISEEAKNQKEKIVYSGFIAQEVEKAAKETGYDFSGVDAPKNEKDLYGLRYAEFVVPLVKAVQELSVISKTKDAQISKLQDENAALVLRLEKIEAQMGISTVAGKNSWDQSEARLEQNIPNPATNGAVIRFWIPRNVSEAMLIIADANGKVIQQFDHLNSGASEVELATTQLSQGIYSYTLYIEGRAIDTKQMVITK